MQLINTLPCSWKTIILEDIGNSISISVYNNYLIKNSQVYVVNKLNSKELHVTQNMKNNLVETCFTVILRISFQNKFELEKCQGAKNCSN